MQHAVYTTGMLQYKKQEFQYTWHFVCIWVYSLCCLCDFHITLRMYLLQWILLVCVTRRNQVWNISCAWLYQQWHQYFKVEENVSRLLVICLVRTCGFLIISDSKRIFMHLSTHPRRKKEL
jgi:hypothetical protein